MTKHFDIIILGAGMIGLTLALKCADNNFNVAIIDKNKIPADNKKENNPRVSSFNCASRNLLQKLNVWQTINKAAINPLEKMCVWDGLGGAEIEFSADEIDQAEMGFIVENREVVSALTNAALQKDNVTVFSEASLESYTVSDSDVSVNIRTASASARQSKINAALLVGADGANSWLRKQIEVEVKQKSYNQTAITAVIKSEKKHNNTAFQVFAKDGPLALLPLNNPQHTSMVWSVKTERANELLTMDAEELSCEILNEFGDKLGNVNVISKTKSFPLTMRHVKHYVQDRIALVGDAAHTIHPLAGQGANLGLQDVAVLADVLTQAKNKKQDIGSFKTLRKYERARKGDNTQMAIGMRLFKELFGSDEPFLVQARNIGFNAVEKLPLLKKCFMQYAAGAKYDAK